MGQLIEKEVEQLKDRFQFSAEMIEKWKKRERYYFFHSFFDKVFSETGVILKEQQMTSILDQWQQKKSQWQLSIGNNWVLKREYHFVILAKKRKQSHCSDRRSALVAYSRTRDTVERNRMDWSGQT